MSVVRDMGMKSPYVGQVPLVSGEIAEDFANYYVVSEQTPTLQSLGVLVSGEVVLSAGGVLLQPMPGCTDEIISQLELRSPLFEMTERELAAIRLLRPQREASFLSALQAANCAASAWRRSWRSGLRASGPWCLPGRQCATGATARGRVWKRRSSPWAARSWAA